MTSELDALLETVGKRGFLFHAFRTDRHGPESLAAIRDLGGWADVVVLVDEDHASAYRTPTGPGIDPLAPNYAYWTYAANPSGRYEQCSHWHLPDTRRTPVT